MTWRVIWTPVDEWWPSFVDHEHRMDAEADLSRLRLRGITDATIHNLGESE